MTREEIINEIHKECLERSIFMYLMGWTQNEMNRLYSENSDYKARINMAKSLNNKYKGKRAAWLAESIDNALSD